MSIRNRINNLERKQPEQAGELRVWFQDLDDRELFHSQQDGQEITRRRADIEAEDKSGDVDFIVTVKQEA